ncbi:hypothetical protein vBRpoSV10_121 [Ruegeria phage vB_RpoS-V10]|nr:hypothetical protein vBRpoSV10_121 [Ruegeria phage vB_RpoS-V10]
MSKKNQEKLIETIKALRARAADSGSSEAEVDAAINRADRLMREHEVSLDDLNRTKAAGGIIRGEWSLGTKKIHVVEYIASAVTRLTETRGWVSSRDGVASLVFYGFEADVEYALYIVDLVHNAMEAEWAKYRESGALDDYPRNKRGSIRDTFLKGMGARIREKLVTMAAANSLAMTETATTGTALVVVKREMVNEAFDSLEMDISKRRASTKKHYAGPLFAGMAAGERTNITTGIGADA